jgi:hypothetical protein
MMVCVIGLVSMAELMAVTLRLQQLGRNSTAAVRLAQSKVDELTTMDFATGPQVQCAGSLTTDVANFTDLPEGPDGVGVGYRRRWVVSAGPDGDNNMRVVTVRVIPDIPDRRVASPYDLTTIIRGVNDPC